MMKTRGERKQDALLDDGFGLCSVAAAVIGGAVIGAGASMMSSSKAANAQEDAADKASSTQLAAQREAQAFEQKQIDQARIDSEPWRQAGVGALNKLAGMPDFTGASVGSDPGYQFGLTEGMKGVTNSAAARGGLLSGAALKAASRYNNDYATTKFDDAFNHDVTTKNRLASLAGVGQVATSQNNAMSASMGQNVANGMMSTASGIGNNLMGAGNARASGYLANGNTLVNGLNQGISAWNQYRTPSAALNPYTTANQYSGGNDGWTMPNGESLGT